MPKVTLFDPEPTKERVKELREKYPSGFMTKNQIGLLFGNKNTEWKNAFCAPLKKHKSLTSTRILYRIEDVARREYSL